MAKRIYHNETWTDGYGMIPVFKSEKQALKAKQLVFDKYGVNLVICQDDIPYAYQWLVLPTVDAELKDEVTAYLFKIKENGKI